MNATHDTKDERPSPGRLTNEHLANERTLLAWIRTGIGVMAFGFVVVKFSLFIRQMTLLLGTPNQVHQYGYSAPIGIFLVILGGLSIAFGTYRYRATEKQLKTGPYRHTSGWLYAFVAFLLLVTALLTFYLVRTT